MEYIIPPIVLLLIFRFGVPVLITWFFERFVEPKAKEAREQCQAATPFIELSNAQKIDATRKDLDNLRVLLKKN